MKIIMRRDCVIFHLENNTIDNAVKAVSFNLKRVLDNIIWCDTFINRVYAVHHMIIDCA